MTIRDIARIAKVSPATVSKIYNKKDENISPETRNHVLQVIKECNYSPYSRFKAAPKGTSLMIGIVLTSGERQQQKLCGILDTLHIEGYNAIVCSCCDKEEEQKKISLLSANGVDGIIWIGEETDETVRMSEHIPYIIVKNDSDENEPEHFGVKFSEMAYFATNELINRCHKKIMCLLPDRSVQSEHFREGYMKRMMESGYNEKSHNCYVADEEDLSIQMSQHTAIVCFENRTAQKAAECANSLNVLVPKELSIVCVNNNEKEETVNNEVSTIGIDSVVLGQYAAFSLIAKIENRESEKSIPSFIRKLNHNNTIDVSNDTSDKRIVVVGCTNMDTYYTISDTLRHGDKVVADSCMKMPGGKGLNQAIGVARLGISTHIISCLGKDYEGGMIFDCLRKNNVDVSGIFFTKQQKTGSCQILNYLDGETVIIGYNGASDLLGAKHIVANENLFKNAGYCIVQDAGEEDLVEQTVRTAHQFGCKVLLRAGKRTSAETTFFQDVDIFMPNRKSLERLLPGSESYEKKAQYFLDKGVKQVIITLGHKGCYLKDQEHSCFFPAIDVKPIDTTGAADEFSATLCAYLLEGSDITEAIKYATVAAGLSTSRCGAVPSMVDRETLELYMSKQGI